MNIISSVTNFILGPKRRRQEAEARIRDSAQRAASAAEELRISIARNAISRDKAQENIIQLTEALQRYINNRD